MYPKFLGIGAQKAGSSWLHVMLSTHPDIWLPPAKEIHYFDHKFPVNRNVSKQVARPHRVFFTQNFSRRLGKISGHRLGKKLKKLSIANLAWDLKFYFGRRDDQWYAALFGQGKARLTGDITPAYSRLDRTAIEYAHNLMPDSKIILLLRDPIERAWSHALMDLARFRNRRPDQVPEKEYIQHFNSTASRLRGSYFQILENWKSVYPEEQVFIGFFDQILENPAQLYKATLDFLGVSSSEDMIPAKLNEKINKGEKIPIPENLKKELINIYMEDLQQLACQFGSYPEKWLAEASAYLKTST